ncbi:uncharacterized protein TRIADDRAFT_54143 [Trichoplax adhaerens]|uniref:UDP-glucuronosyltransferase n=1 Tax=Trichoplax adhaerens TaxID=10228 RepID=B3RR83_TRIAD|nr:hypothetical protein TRIADDRAFT_54143 [Trichoplax adhaerens]EDV26300.1 hypothetical protein TRIADDRAFT_54143 [Trichoplax adhaerens]|eukprot:XP_002110296.1 hypothetical protein TRIADDRAFT_54143 [Trichoplax adhaerens]
MGGSHVLTMDIITQQLIERGHETVTIISNQPGQLRKMKPSPTVLYNVENPIIAGQRAANVTKLSLIGLVQSLFEIQRQYCEATLANDTLVRLLDDVDIFVTDSLYICGVLVPEMLQKPNIIISLGADIIGYHTFLADYADSTYIPMLGFFHSTKLTMIQRAFNAAIKQFLLITYSYMSSNLMNSLRYKFNISTQSSHYRIKRNPSLFLAACDFALEYPRPLPPNIKVIGPLSPRPSSSLSKELEDYMQASDNGIIVLSLGTELQLPKVKATEMLKALAQIPYRVLWKGNQPEETISDNVKVIKWMPQNDILGHNKTVGFITHCGANGLYEAAYHGVPMIGMPSMIEQKGNAGRMVSAGIGVLINYHQFQAKDIVKAVQEITTNGRYKENVMKVSRILKSRPRAPRDVVVDWVEYVANTNGAHHLKVKGEELWLYEYYNLDVCLFIAMIMYFIYLMMRVCKNMMLGKQSKLKDD